jgi:hypothetical protein
MKALKEILKKLDRIDDCFKHPEKGTNTRPHRLVDDVRKLVKLNLHIVN